jgi:hypothetical protein
MKNKCLLAGAALFLSVVAVGSAKSWDIVVDNTAKAGTLELPKGDYHMSLNGNQAVFTAIDSGKKYSVSAKVEQVTQKYADTAVENTTDGNMEVIQSIELGGTTTKVDFGE